jgi:hypothetical protein
VPKVNYIQTLSDQIYAELSRIAEKKGIGVQELIRAIIIPDWIHVQERRTR